MNDSTPNSHAILVVGPSPDLIGGMATVVGNHLSLRDPRIRISFLPLPLGNRPGLFRSLVRHVAHTVQLILAIGRNDVHVLHFHTCSGTTFWRTSINMCVARALGCQVVLHVHGGEFEEFHSISGRQVRYMIRHCLQLADRVIALSSRWRRAILRIAPDADVSIIENAVENAPSHSTADRAGPVCHFLLLAKMDESKGVIDALEACRLLADSGISFHLTLAGPSGTAGDANALNERIKKLGLDDSVRFVGVATGELKEQLFQQCDVLLLPSWFEGMPITVLEAFARSIAVIATSVGGVPEVVSNGVSGLLVPPRSTAAIADAMRSLVENPERRAEFASAGKRLADERFSIARFHRDLADLCAELTQATDGHFRQAISPVACFARPIFGRRDLLSGE
ncbi:MAG: glycosyltransferase family 4 protein [Planctomycetes bacterium]|nr:glycosyltransferase family 4 protein [Planctomycetota bacterium]MBI3835426.1 glycosyltransferase family 4 protein [Planctomycetota bacterium]